MKFNHLQKQTTFEDYNHTVTSSIILPSSLDSNASPGYSPVNDFTPESETL